MGATGERALLFEDLERAFAVRDPRFAERLCAYAQQPDPPESAAEDHDPSEPLPRLDPETFTLARLRGALAKWNLAYRSEDERRALREEAWTKLEAAPHPPPRLRLHALIARLDELASEEGGGDPWAREQLVHVIRHVRLGWGVWKGLKQVYKNAEARFDAELFGALAWRFDVGTATPTTGEISGATFAYLKRRAWRFLRQLGLALPELYPHFAVQVLRHYDARTYLYGTWVLPQIWAHQDLIGARSSWITRPPQDLSRRAFDEAWKRSPDPLLRLLEDGQNDAVLDFAVRGLEQDFAETLRSLDVSWLARIGRRPLARLHRFFVARLEASPELHQSTLKEKGLHDVVLGLLKSADAEAARYAVAYATAHAPDLDDAFLLDLAANAPNEEARKLAVARFEARAPQAIGLDRLVEMVRVSALSALAQKKLRDGFRPTEMRAEHYVALRLAGGAGQAFVGKWFEEAKEQPPAAWLVKVAESADLRNMWQRRPIMAELQKRSPREIGIGWIQEALLDARFSSFVQQWLRGGMLKGEDLDVDWLKGLVMRPALRPLALELLGRPAWVAPREVGLGWLLAMSRQADPQLAEFAHRYLLQHFAPADFAADGGLEAGVARLWALTEPSEPEAVRTFAATYLLVHHPELGPQTAEARQLGIEPRLGTEAYPLAKVRPLFDDALPALRRAAVAIGRRELGRWGDAGLPYALASSRFAETRRFGLGALLAIGQDTAPDDGVAPVTPPPIEWLDAARVFALAESKQKATREAAMTLLREHYERIGGATRLGWLMESPERDVRLFAVRLLWDRRGDEFEDAEALRQFLRTVLFGLPPGRMERRGDDALGERPLPASVAKRRLVEVVRDMAVDDAGFARVALPVLEAFMHSEAKGEWQACVAALARIRRVHAEIDTALPPAEAWASAAPAEGNGASKEARA